MGNSVSYVGSHLRRLLNRYNAQYRALTYLDKEKLPAAPRHATPSQIHEDPAMLEHLQTKDPNLDKYLKDVYVKSDEVPLAIENQNPSRPLPEYDETSCENAFKDPKQSLKGFCTLTDFFKFRSQHEDNPETYNAAAIAKDYNLDVKKVENVLKYFGVFVVYDKSNANSEPFRPGEQPLLFQPLQEEYDTMKSGKLTALTLRDELLKDSKSQKEALNSEKEKETVKATREAVKNH